LTSACVRQLEYTGVSGGISIITPLDVRSALCRARAAK